MTHATNVMIILSALLAAGLVIVCAVTVAQNAEGKNFRIIKEWRFECPGDMQGWTAGNITDVKVENGALRGKPTTSDPILCSPIFEMPANEFQWVRVTMRCASDGQAEFYYSNTTKGQYGGFSPKKLVTLQMTGGTEFRTYDIRPFWGPEKKIVHIRLDPPNTGPFELKAIQIVEDTEQTVSEATAWDLRSQPAGAVFAQRTRIDAESFNYVVLRMAVKNAFMGRLSFALDNVNGLHTFLFPLRADGRMHIYNLEPDTKLPWSGRIIYVALEPAMEPGAQVTLDSMKFAHAPEGPPDIEVQYFGLSDALPRAGNVATLTCTLYNYGGDSTTGLTARLTVPAGVQVQGNPVQSIEPIPNATPHNLEWKIVARQQLKGEAQMEIIGLPEPLTATAPLEFAPSLNLPKADYVPEPKPVDTQGYQVGVYYFPGWHDATRWAPIQSWPNRKPVLGWYAEGSPEVADWHIKWAVEHGITFFAYDWYWCKGGRSLEHALHDGYMKARYRHLLKFCLLWANHNPKGTSSQEDLLKVTDYWIEHYFKLPEYVTVDGKPLVIIFSPWRLTEDMGSDAVRVAFDKMRERCRQRGLPGLYLAACGNDQVSLLQRLHREGYDAVTAYNWPTAGMKPGQMRAPYDLLVNAYPLMWNEILRANLLNLITPISGGWDSRPWHGPNALARTDMNPQNFQRHCADAKRLIDERNLHPKMVIIEAWNEWGEGSYIEPHAQWGFGYLDAIRNVFAPHAGPHTDITPADIGLGPYDVKPVAIMTEWHFDTDGDVEGWSAAMQIANLRAEGGCLKFESAGNDPALTSPPLGVHASRFSQIVIRMKASRNEKGQLFWATPTMPTNEHASIRFDVIGDGAMHEYTLPVSENRRWRSIIKQLRLDPGVNPGTKFEIDYICLRPR